MAAATHAATALEEGSGRRTTGPEEGAAGVLNTLLTAVRSSVALAFFGPAKTAAKKGAAAEEEEQAPDPAPGGTPLDGFVPSLPEDWLDSVRLPMPDLRLPPLLDILTSLQEGADKELHDSGKPRRPDEPATAEMRSGKQEAQAEEAADGHGVAEEEGAEAPPPAAPGMDEANLVVRVAIEPREAEVAVSGEEGVALLMSQNSGIILSMMAQAGWDVQPIEPAKGLYEISMPAVRYELPGGAVSIPQPRFTANVRDVFRPFAAGDCDERLQGDLVLQNGDEILTVELNFPFRTKFTVSAAGWARPRICFRGNKVVMPNYVEIGLQLPRVIGLNSIMQYFVKSYGGDSTQQCVDALARGADQLASETPEAAKDAVESLQDWWEAAQASMASLPLFQMWEPNSARAAEAAVETLSETVKEADDQPAPVNLPMLEAQGMDKVAEAPADDVAAGATAAAAEVLAEAPRPHVPGMSEANLTVRVSISPKEAAASSADAARRIMSQSGGTILGAMVQEGWKVRLVDASKSLYELSLPAVRYELPGGAVSIPAPRFLTPVRDGRYQEDAEVYQERLQGDLILQNGEGILKVELSFPWRTTLSISAAGWTRCSMGWKGEAISVANEIEIGLFLPQLPGLGQLLQYFVRNYGAESTEQVAQALARSADNLASVPDPSAEIARMLGAMSSSASQAFEAARGTMSELELPPLLRPRATTPKE